MRVTSSPAPKRSRPEGRYSRTPEKVVAWRAEHLLELGFTIEQTLSLVNRSDVVHEAEALIARGCPLSFVYDELSD